MLQIDTGMLVSLGQGTNLQVKMRNPEVKREDTDSHFVPESWLTLQLFKKLKIFEKCDEVAPGGKADGKVCAHQ